MVSRSILEPPQAIGPDSHGGGESGLPDYTTAAWPSHAHPLSTICGLGTRLCMRMRTQLEDGVLRNGQQLQCAVNGT